MSAPTTQALLAKAAALAAQQAEILARLAAALEAPPPPPPEDDGAILTPDELATALRVTRTQVYSLAKREDWRPYTVRIGRRVLRFRRSLLDWLRCQGGP